MFIVEYDSVERVIRYNGHPIFSFHQNNIDSERKVAIELLVAHPPNCISKITVGDWDSSKSQMMGKSEHYPDKFNGVIYDKDLISDLFIINVAQIQDTVRKMTLTDTLILKVNRSGVEHFKAKLSWR